MLGQYTGLIAALMFSLAGIVNIISALKKPNANNIAYSIKVGIVIIPVLVFSLFYSYYEFL